MTDEFSVATRVEYLHPSTPAAPGRWARMLLEPLPWWVWPAVAVVLVAPFVWWLGRPLAPVTLYLWPALAIVFGGLSVSGVVVVFGVRGALRHRIMRRYGVSGERVGSEGRDIRATLIALACFWGVVGTPLGMWTGAAIRIARMEDIRQQVASGTMPRGGLTMFPFKVSDTELYNNGVVILYTDGGMRGDFPGGGSGFLYVPEGVDFPPYNVGSDGRLFGRWYWFTTD